MKKMIVSLIIVMFLTVILVETMQAKKISKRGSYGGGNAKECAEHFGNKITKVKYKGNKVMFTGGLYYTYQKDGINYNPTTIRGKKLTFKISKKCKYYRENYSNKVSKKKFKRATSPIKKNMHISFEVKKKKIVKLLYYRY